MIKGTYARAQLNACVRSCRIHHIMPFPYRIGLFSLREFNRVLIYSGRVTCIKYLCDTSRHLVRTCHVLGTNVCRVNSKCFGIVHSVIFILQNKSPLYVLQHILVEISLHISLLTPNYVSLRCVKQHIVKLNHLNIMKKLSCEPLFIFPEEVSRNFEKYGKAHFSHTSLCRGYFGLTDGRIDSYSGKFGLGFIIHHPTRRCPDGTSCGNRFHVITYYLFYV